MGVEEAEGPEGKGGGKGGGGMNCISLYNYETKRTFKNEKGGMRPMKKFISMVMAAAMVVSLVPATAFADTGSAKAVAKVIDASGRC